MVESLDADTLAQWQAVATNDGWGEDNERAARICSAVHNSLMIAISKKGGAVEEKDFKNPEDFIPRFRFEAKVKSEPTQTPEQMIAIGKRIAGIK